MRLLERQISVSGTRVVLSVIGTGLQQLAMLGKARRLRHWINKPSSLRSVGVTRLASKSCIMCVCGRFAPCVVDCCGCNGGPDRFIFSGIIYRATKGILEVM